MISSASVSSELRWLAWGSGMRSRITAIRFTSSEIPCMNSIANATMISALDGHCARPPAFPDCSLISTERRKKGIPVTTMMMVSGSRKNACPTASMLSRTRFGSMLFTMSMRMCSLSSSVQGAHSRNTALNSTHCNSSQEFDEVSKILRTVALTAETTTAVNATVRKIFDTSSNSWLELQWVLFSAVFLLCAPWTLLDNEHIRIDIVNNMLSKRVRDSIDAVGHAFFLLPLTIIMVVTGIPFFLRSVEINEQSGNAGGLAQWPSKALIMVAFAMLFMQGISELVKRIAVMRDLIPDPHASQRSSLETEAEEIISAIEKH